MAARQRAADFTVVWESQPGPQTALLSCPVFEVFFGGARGGGKTDGMLGDWVSHQDLYGKEASGLMVRRTLRDLEDTIKRSRSIYVPLGAKFHEQDKIWRFPSGSEIKYRYLDNDADADHYQGHSYTRVYVEELTQFPSSVPVFKLMATLRSGVGVPCGFRATGNPGGPGHQWVKTRYIDPNPTGWKIVKTELSNPWTGSSITRDRVFIPSKLRDNHFLGDEYVANLQLSGNAALVKAWLEGDWSVIDGAFFSEWSNAQHVIAPFAIPDHWLRFRSGDWGSQAPFSIGWWAVVGDDHQLQGSANSKSGGSNRRRHIRNDELEREDGRSDGMGRSGLSEDWRDSNILPRGSLVRYREWYGKVGGKLTADQVGNGIFERERSDAKLSYGVLDPAAFTEDGGPSIAERINNILLSHQMAAFTRADNARVSRSGDSSKGGAMGGWDQMRSRMIGSAKRNEDGAVLWNTGRPMLYCFSTCTDSIRTIPTLQHDKSRAEDLDTSAEDHCFAAGTLIETVNGLVPIDKLSEAGSVLSLHSRYEAYRSARMTRRNAELVKLTFSNGVVVRCTKDHKFLVDFNEWSYAENLQGKEVLCARPLSARQFRNSTAQDIISAENTFSAKAFDFTLRFGNTIAALCQSVATFITKTKIDLTTILTTSNALPSRHTWAVGMEKPAPYVARGVLRKQSPPPAHGIGQTKEGRGTQRISSRISFRQWSAVSPQFVRNAVTIISLVRLAWSKVSFAALIAERVRCVSVENESDRADVYCLTVPTTGCFAIQGGILVSNCADDWRYACMSRPWVKPKPTETPGQRDTYRPRSGDDRNAGSIATI